MVTPPPPPPITVSVDATAIAQDYYVVDALAGNPLATVAAYEADWKRRFGWTTADAEQAQRWADTLARYRGPVGDELEDEAPRPQPRFVTAPVQADRVAFGFLGARDAADAWSRVALVTTPEDLAALKGCMTHFGPKLATWRAAYPFAGGKADGLRDVARRHGVEGFLGRAARWFGVPDGLPLGLRFSVVPLPAGATSSRARVIENYSAIELAAGDQPVDQLDSLVHEVCHHLIDRAGLLDRPALAAAYAADPELGVDAFGLLNEGVATALGHGVFMDAVRPVRDVAKERWRKEDFLDAYSHALYPIAKRHLASGQPLGAGFVGEAIAAYRASVPRTVLPTLHHVLFLADDRSLRQVLRRAAMPNVINRSSLADGPEALARSTAMNVFLAATPAQLAENEALWAPLGLARADALRLSASTSATMVVRQRPAPMRGRAIVVVASQLDTAIRAAVRLPGLPAEANLPELP